MKVLEVTDVKYLLLSQSHISSRVVSFNQLLIMENLLLEAITHVKNSKKKPTVKRLLAHINSLGANNWEESVVEQNLCILHTKGMINTNYKTLIKNNTSILLSDDKLLETPLFSSSDDTLPHPSLLLFQELQFSTSNITTTIIHSAVTPVTPNSHSKKNSNHNKHDLKIKRIEKLNAELKGLKYFIREEPYLMKRMIEELQGEITQ